MQKKLRLQSWGQYQKTMKRLVQKVFDRIKSRMAKQAQFWKELAKLTESLDGECFCISEEGEVVVSETGIANYELSEDGKRILLTWCEDEEDGDQAGPEYKLSIAIDSGQILLAGQENNKKAILLMAASCPEQLDAGWLLSELRSAIADEADE